MQKQSSEGFLKNSVKRNFAKFTRKQVCRNHFFEKVKLCSVDLQLHYKRDSSAGAFL